MKTIKVQETYRSNNIVVLCDGDKHYYQTNEYTKYFSKCKKWYSCTPNVKVVLDK